MLANVIAKLAMVGGISMFLSWLIYVPIYLLMLRRRAPDLYERLGGIPIMRAASLRLLARFLINKSYLSSQDEVVHRHSRILSVTLLGGIAAAVGGSLLCAALAQGPIISMPLLL